MQKITLILPYFGESFPNYFDILLDSIKYNEKINFLIITNIELNNSSNINNLKVVHSSFEHMKKIISDKFNRDISLSQPYKLCDYRPFYGLIFEEYLKNSDWWGYFDSDVVLGNLNYILKSDLLKKYDRVFTHGHLTLYRNTKKVNEMPMIDFKCNAIPSWKEVVSSNTNFAFDEWGWGKNKGRGISWIIDKTKYLNQYDDINLFADCVPDSFKFQTTSKLNIKYFIYDNGVLTGIDGDNNSHNFLYAHFQKRAMKNKIESLNKPIYIFPNYFSNEFNLNIENYEIYRWKKVYIKRKFKQIKNNLNLSYFKRRIRFMNSEKNN